MLTSAFGSIARFFSLGYGPGPSRYAGGRDRSHSTFNTALDRSQQNPYSFQSRGSAYGAKDHYGQVRDRVAPTSPDAKMYQPYGGGPTGAAPVRRFGAGGGTVLSPQSLYRQPDSVYKESRD